MTLYYFNVYNDDITMDDEGAELADPHAAHAYAVKAVRSLAADTVLHGHLVGWHRVDYVDSDQKTVGSVRFDEAVDIKL